MFGKISFVFFFLFYCGCEVAMIQPREEEIFIDSRFTVSEIQDVIYCIKEWSVATKKRRVDKTPLFVYSGLLKKGERYGITNAYDGTNRIYAVSEPSEMLVFKSSSPLDNPPFGGKLGNNIGIGIEDLRSIHENFEDGEIRWWFMKVILHELGHKLLGREHVPKEENSILNVPASFEVVDGKPTITEYDLDTFCEIYECVY